MNRTEVLRVRRRRRRTILSIAFMLALGVLVTAGIGLGAAVGFAADRVRSSELLASFLPVEEPSLPAAKQVPPPPVDISGPAVACAASALTLTVHPDATEADPGQPVGMHVTVTHSGRYPCLVNGGMENLRLRIVDAAGLVGWSAADCGLTGSRALLMGPGNQIAWDVTWDGLRSIPGGCTGGQPPLTPGTWQLIASLGEVAHSDSDPVNFVVRAPYVPEPEPEPLPEVISEPELVFDDAAVEPPIVDPVAPESADG